LVRCRQLALGHFGGTTVVGGRSAANYKSLHPAQLPALDSTHGSLEFLERGTRVVPSQTKSELVILTVVPTD